MDLGKRSLPDGTCIYCTRAADRKGSIQCCNACSSTKGVHHTLGCDERHARAADK